MATRNKQVTDLEIGDCLCDMHCRSVFHLPELWIEGEYVVDSRLAIDHPGIGVLLNAMVRDKTDDKYWSYHNKFLYVVDVAHLDQRITCMYSYDGTHGGIVVLKPKC